MAYAVKAIKVLSCWFLNRVDGDFALEASKDSDVDVFSGLVIGAHLHEEVHAGDDLKYCFIY